jgi:DNA-binding CsgD family transcriptional regulator
MKLDAEVDASLSPLSKRENEVLELMAQGLTRPAIAAFIFRSKHTIDHHFNHIFEKLEADNSTQAVAIGMMCGFLRVSKHLCLILATITTFNAIMPSSAMASDQPITRVRIRGGAAIRSGNQMSLRNPPKTREPS